MQVADARVLDEFGGSCGNPSKEMPAKYDGWWLKTNTTNKTNTTANKTANKTRMLATKAYSIKLFVQPDVTADTYDNAAVVTKAKSAGMLTALKAAVTDKGTLTVTSKTVTEAKVAWKTAPTGAVTTTTIKLSGEVGKDSMGYVVCMVSKDGSRRLATANNTTKTNTTAATTTKAATGTATATSYKNMLTDKTLSSVFNF
jgi:hypothetical protein